SSNDDNEYALSIEAHDGIGTIAEQFSEEETDLKSVTPFPSQVAAPSTINFCTGRT
ncbi:unnamed protein product, partial [Didymodactylos carnosus]